jgi:predicted aconitase
MTGHFTSYKHRTNHELATGASLAGDATTAMYHIDGVTESGAVPNGC